MHFAIATAACLGLGISLLLISLALRFGWDAIARSRTADWHHEQSRPVSRLGGAALVVAFVVIELFIGLLFPQLRANTPGRNVIVISSLGMFALGFWDDLRPLAAVCKLTGQVVLAAFVWLGGVGIEVWRVPFTNAIMPLGFWGPIVTIVWLVSLTNLINLVDGVDGFAGGLCLMLMVLIATVAHQNGNFELLAAGMAGALIGFLRFNFPPARIYLGDGGAYFLGFQIGLYSIVNSRKGTVLAALIAPLFLLVLPITDAVLTVARRGLRGLPLFRPDRNHLHHHLISGANSHRKVVLGVYGLNLIFLVMGLGAFWSQGQWVPMLVGAVVLVLFACAGSCEFSRRWFAVGQMVRSSLTMRGEVQYALCLARWLELESRRRSGPDELWPDLVFAADKLGFGSLKLTLEDRHKVWRRPGESSQGTCRRYNCPNSHHGSLEFTGPACLLNASGRLFSCHTQAKCASRVGRCLADPRVFETISELLAEAWNKAACHWHRRRIPLRFHPEPLDLTARLNGFGRPPRPGQLQAGHPAEANNL